MSPLPLTLVACGLVVVSTALTPCVVSAHQHHSSPSLPSGAARHALPKHVHVSRAQCPEEHKKDGLPILMSKVRDHVDSDPWPHPPSRPRDPPPRKPVHDPIPPRYPPPPPPGDGNEKDPMPHPRPLPPRPPTPPPPHERDPIPPRHPPPPHDDHPPHDSDPLIPGPSPPHDPEADLPDLDHRPHYNRLLHAASRLQFVPPFVFLVLLGLHSVLLWAGEAYQQRRRELLHVHPEAGGPIYRARIQNGRSEYQPRRTSDTSIGNLGMAPSAEPLDLTQRDDAERAVASYVEEVRGTQSVVRESHGSGDPEIEPLLPRTSATMTTRGPGMGMEGTSGAERSGPSMDRGEASLLGGMGSDDVDPILLLFSEPDTEWGPSISPSPLERRPLIVQPDALRAVKNGGQVAAMLFIISLALALMGILAVTALPQPAAYPDMVGSRMRTFTVILSQWTILGVGIMWALGEATFLAIHDLHRARILATLTIFVMLIVYGVSLEAENRARLNEIDRIHRPSPGPFPSPPHVVGSFVFDVLADVMSV